MESSIDISVNHALIAVFTIGILVGYAGGVVAPVNFSDSGPKKSGDVQKDFTFEDEPVLGEEDAPVTVIAFEEYQCPFCKKFEEGSFQQIKTNYVETGKVRVVWKDYPLPPKIHPWAGKAAAYTECVYRQDEEAYWSLKPRIFDRQSTLTVDSIDDKIIEWSSEYGVNGTQVRQCAQSESVKQEINQDMQEGGRIGTPTLYIGKTGSNQYIKISGAQPYSVFENAIETKING